MYLQEQHANRIKTRKGRSTLMMAPSKWGFPVAPFKVGAQIIFDVHIFLFVVVSITGVDAI